MQTQKQKDKEKNVKIQLINLVSTIHLMSYLINSLNDIYRNYSRSLVRFLCVAVYLQDERGYFYKSDLYSMLPYQQRYFENLLSKYRDNFRVIESNHKGRKLVLSESGVLLLNSFYVSFINQLSKSVD